MSLWILRTRYERASFSDKALLPFTESSPSRPWVSSLPWSIPPPTFKVPEVLTAAESGCSPEQWKNKLLKALFPCSEYFYKANPQRLSPHTQLFFSFLTRSSGQACGDSKWQQEGGSYSWLWVGWIFWELWIWFGQRTLLGEGAEVKWKQLPPCLCALFIVYDPQGPQPLAFLENGDCQEQWSQESAFLKATVSWIRAADKGALIDFVPCAALGSWLSPTDSSLLSHTDQSLSQMRLVGGWLKSQKGQSCVGDRACSEFPTTMFLSSWGPKASLNTRSSENSPGFSGNRGWLCHFLSK